MILMSGLYESYVVEIGTITIDGQLIDDVGRRTR